MKNKEGIFTVIFVLTLALALYFLGATSVGYLTKSMHCDDGVCRDLCQFDTDCAPTEVCCDKFGYGICDEEDSCIVRHVFKPDMRHNIESGHGDISKRPNIESPRPVYGINIVLFLLISLMILTIGVLYYLTEPQ